MTWTTTEKKSTLPVIIMGALAFNTCVSANELLYSDVERLPDYTDEKSVKIRNLSGDHWLTINTETEHVDEDEHKLVGISDVIKHIKVGLGLPNKDIAKIFGVTRQTLYNYLKQSDKNSVINPNTLERSLMLKKVAKNLSGIFNKSPGAMAKNFTIEEQSLLDLLSEEDLNIDKISIFAVKLSKRMSQHSSSSDSVSNNITLMELTRHS